MERHKFSGYSFGTIADQKRTLPSQEHVQHYIERQMRTTIEAVLPPIETAKFTKAAEEMAATTKATTKTTIKCTTPEKVIPLAV